MSGRDDITNLFHSKEEAEPYRQGEILTYNIATGENTVRVGLAVLTNLPLLNIGDTINLQGGDAVVLLKFRSSWAILGRVLVPGSSAVQSAAVEFKTMSASATNFTVPVSTPATRCTGSVIVPDWANQCSCVIVGMLGAFNPTGSSDILNAYIEIQPGLFGSVPYMNVVPGTFASVTPSIAATFNVTPGATLNPILLASTSGGTWAADANNRASMSGTFIFRKA